FQAEDGIRDFHVTGVQTCALPILGASGAAVCAAIAVGLEVTARLGMAGFDPVSRNSVFFEHGQHATSICGALGSAVAAAMLYGEIGRASCRGRGWTPVAAV